jgi:hypothetical protein
MVNSGKRKYTKKNMKGGEGIIFSLVEYTKNGLNTLPNPFRMKGEQVLTFIDGTTDTFFNAYRHVKFSKSFSKCYLSDQDGTMLPYQLIYYDSDKNVYQVTANQKPIFKLVEQDSLIKGENAVKKLLSVNNSKSVNNSNINLIVTTLRNAILHGNISIDEVLKFFFINGNKNKGFRVDGNLQKIWDSL